MKSKNLIILVIVAVVLGVAAVVVSNNSRPAAPRLNGRHVLADLDLSKVASIDIGGKLQLAAGENGWQISSMFGFPADREKITENLLKLKDLKVGQVVRGRKLGAETAVTLKDAAGTALAELKLGDRRSGKVSGRYLGFEGETVLVEDTLDAFGDDAKKWCKTRIASVESSKVKAVSFKDASGVFELEKGTNGTWQAKGLKADEELDTSKTYSLDSALSYLDFTSVADPKLTEAELGFSTGSVYSVTYTEGSNTVTRTATVGAKAKDGRYVKLDGDKWVYTIADYAAGNLSKTRKDLVKAKEKPKAEEKKPDEKKK